MLEKTFKEGVTKQLKQACCKEKTNELRSKNSEAFEFTDMPVCFGTRLCGYRNRGWTYVDMHPKSWTKI